MLYCIYLCSTIIENNEIFTGYSNQFSNESISEDGSLKILLRQYNATITMMGHITKILIDICAIWIIGKMNRKMIGMIKNATHIKLSRRISRSISITILSEVKKIKHSHYVFVHSCDRYFGLIEEMLAYIQC